jgi:SAM-dependent methyltransferase
VRAAFPSATVIAVDSSLAPLAAYRASPFRVVADAARLPCPDRSVDGVCAFDVLEHLDDDAAALKEWRRALSPGGWLVATVPAYRSLWSRHDDVNGHRRRYRRSRLQALLRAAGFATVRMSYFNTLLLPPIALWRWSERLWTLTPGDGLAQAPAGTELDFARRFPGWIERAFESALRAEARWLRRHSLPAGVSIGVVARAEGHGR